MFTWMCPYVVMDVSMRECMHKWICCAMSLKDVKGCLSACLSRPLGPRLSIVPCGGGRARCRETVSSSVSSS